MVNVYKDLVHCQKCRRGIKSESGIGGYGIPMIQCSLDHHHRSATKGRICFNYKENDCSNCGNRSIVDGRCLSNLTNDDGKCEKWEKDMSMYDCYG